VDFNHIERYYRAVKWECLVRITIRGGYDGIRGDDVGGDVFARL
jgi:hypothetical protein